MATVNCLNTYIVPTVANEVTMPSQPAFLELLAANELNVTGNGTVATIGAVSGYTEVYDQGADFASLTFTAPVGGRYKLNLRMWITSTGGATLIRGVIVTSNRNYGNEGLTFNQKKLAVLADMDAGDTAIMQATVNGVGADTSDITAGNVGTGGFTSFSGFLAT